MTGESTEKRLAIQKPIRQPPEKDRRELEPDWTISCATCGSVPTVPVTGLCGPCTYGEADTSGGNWMTADPDREAFASFLKNRDIYLSNHDQLELCWQAALEWERSKGRESAKAVTEQELDRASEQAYWSFRNRKNEHLLRNVGHQTERDAFKAECHKLIAKYRKEIPEGWQLVPKEPIGWVCVDKNGKPHGITWFYSAERGQQSGDGMTIPVFAVVPQSPILEPRNTEPPPHRPSRDIMFDTRPRDE